ncbi:unnamed protein product [Eruca vesicaria subsp. sativa]|uniref:F-box associated beta-propeller type 3 domain-containing protein n=1 Tax=Eruca vesicaria subsp. sativa TaxID=29727 RepID=A0ABC8JSE5_ERUVS|nr:unnamed protein product [Eruca vesicaria subsp. sativa]
MKFPPDNMWILPRDHRQFACGYSSGLIYFHAMGDKLFPHYVSVVGVISTGEIVLSMADYTSGQPFYVYYFNPDQGNNTIGRFEMQGFGEYHEASNNPRRVHVFVDDCSSRYLAFANNIEDINVNDQTLLRSSIYVPYVYNEESEESESERRFR